jgi:hypothetical protein
MDISFAWIYRRSITKEAGITKAIDRGTHDGGLTKIGRIAAEMGGVRRSEELQIPETG